MPKKRPQRPTREQIIDYLSRHPLSTASQIAAAVGLTSADVRYHLAAMRADGVVIAVAKEEQRRKGRPAALFRLTPKAQQQYLEPLTRSLLDTLRHILPPDRLEVAISEALSRGSAPAKKPLRARLQAAMVHLEALQFAPRWEAHRFGPRVILQRCPYASLAAEYPELCRADRLLLERLIGAEVEVVSRGAPPCVFAVREANRQG